MTPLTMMPSHGFKSSCNFLITVIGPSAFSLVASSRFLSGLLYVIEKESFKSSVLRLLASIAARPKPF